MNKFTLASCAVSLSIPLMAGLGAPPASAQSLPGRVLKITPADLGAYTRTGAADLDDDANIDVVYQRGQVVDALLAPGLYEARMQDIGAANDFDVLVKDGADSILTVSSAGLIEHELHTKVLPAWPWTGALRENSAWANATRVRVWSNGPNTQYVFGLSAAGNSILLMKRTWNGSGLGTWTSSPAISLPAGSPVVSIEPFERDGNPGGVPELAVMRASVLTIYSPFSEPPSSTPVANYVGSPTLRNISIARIRQANFTREWVGVVSTLVSDGVTQRFLTVGLEGIRNVQWIGSPLGVVEITAGDVDADGREEIVASMTSSWDLAVVKNTGNATVGPVYDVSDPANLTFRDGPHPGPANNNVAKPLVADIDNDLDGDCGQPLLDYEEFWFGIEPLFNNELLQPKLVLGSEGGEDVAPLVVGPLLATDIQFTFELPAPPSGTTWTSSQRLEVTAWSQKTQTNTLEGKAFFAPANMNLENKAAGYKFTYNTSVPALPADTTTGFSRIVFLVGRILDVDGNERIVRAYPGIVYIAHASCPPVDHGVAAVDCSLNDEFVRSMLEMQEQTHIEFAVASFVAVGPAPGDLGRKVGLGGHVPCMPAPVDGPPHR